MARITFPNMEETVWVYLSKPPAGICAAEKRRNEA